MGGPGDKVTLVGFGTILVSERAAREGRNPQTGATVMSLALNQWVTSHHNILVTGPTGAGKSYLACALAQKACRDGYATLYQRVPRLLQEIAVSRLDDRYAKLIAPITKCEVLIL